MPEVILPERKAFCTPELQQQLQDFGYVRLRLLNDEQINGLMSLHLQLDNPELDYPFYTSNWSEDKNYRRRVDSLVRPILEELVLSKLDNYKSCFSYFLVKRASVQSEFKVHQDWSMVDESRYTGLTLWSPLTDTTIKNGCFHVVEKSHLFSGHPRGSNIPSPYADIQNQIEKQYCKPIEMKAGEAILFDHRLWHYSPKNSSSSDRVAVGMVLIPRETTFIHHMAKEDKVKVFEANDDFLVDICFGDDISKQGYSVQDEYVLDIQEFDLNKFRKLYAKFNNENASVSKMKKFVKKFFR